MICAKNMCFNDTYSIWFMNHKTLKSSNLTQIDAKALPMGLTFILKIYLKFKGRKGRKLKPFFILKDQGVKWEIEQVKTHGILGNAGRGYHEFRRWRLIIMK